MNRQVFNTHEVLVREETIKGSSDRTLGLLFAVVFSAVGLLPLLRHHGIRPWALIVASAFLIPALACPRVLRPLNYVWMRLGLLLQTITSPVILGALFYVVVTPFALVLRLLGKDMLRLRFEPAATTYWMPRNPPGPAAESMRNQF